MVNTANLKHFNNISTQQNCTLVAVTKTRPIADLLDLYKKGQKIYGENRALDLRDKAKDLPKDIEWHFIGHLQSNKIKHIIPYVNLIHSVDSFKLLEAINAQAAKYPKDLKDPEYTKVVNYLLQFHIAKETAKYGFIKTQVNEIVEYFKTNTHPQTQCCGVMGMATFTDNKAQVKEEFLSLKKIFDQLKELHFKQNENFKEISMGMSGDYELAIEAGSTMLRIGSALFSE